MHSVDQHEYWNRVAHQKTFTHPLQLHLLQQRLTTSSLIVDYGCGYGRVVQLLHEAGFSNVQGFDTSSELIERGKQHYPHLHLKHIADAESMPLINNSVDGVLLFAVLTCIPANAWQQAIIQKLHEKLKPGGLLYISDYYQQTTGTEARPYTCLNDDPENDGVFTLPEGATFRHHSRMWIQQLFERFEVLQEMDIEVTTMNGHRAAAFQLLVRKHEQ